MNQEQFNELAGHIEGMNVAYLQLVALLERQGLVDVAQLVQALRANVVEIEKNAWYSAQSRIGASAELLTLVQKLESK